MPNYLTWQVEEPAGSVTVTSTANSTAGFDRYITGTPTFYTELTQSALPVYSSYSKVGQVNCASMMRTILCVRGNRCCSKSPDHCYAVMKYL